MLRKCAGRTLTSNHAVGRVGEECTCKENTCSELYCRHLQQAYLDAAEEKLEVFKTMQAVWFITRQQNEAHQFSRSGRTVSTWWMAQVV